MGILDSTLRQQRSSLLWFALPPSSPVSQRPSLRLRLMPTTATTATLTPMEATGPMAMEPTLTLIMASTTARGPLRLSPPPLPSPMLMPTTTEPMVTEPMVWATEDTPDTLMLIVATTTARGPLMLSPPPLPSLRPTPTTAMVPGPTTAMEATDTLDTTVWATEATGDKFSASEVQSRSSKRTSLLVI